METSPRRETNPNPNPLPSPNSSSTSSTNSNNNNNNGLLLAPPTAQQQQPKPMTRSDSANPYPTTFVQADTNSFKQVVQMLTGSSETANKVVVSASKPDNNNNNNNSTTSSSSSSRHNIPPIKSTPKKQQQQNQQHFKLYERRNSSHLKNHLRLNPLIPNNSASGSNFSPRNTEILSPSILDFPSLVLSPVTPLIPDPFDRSGSANFWFSSGHQHLNKEAEERAIKEKGFYLHPPSPRTPSEPRLLPLFPTTSPRGAGAASGSSSSS